jgi:hypothetical protein
MVVRQTCGNESIAAVGVSGDQQIGTHHAPPTAPSGAAGSDR